MKLLLTTVPGLEFIVREELAELLGQVETAYTPLSGRVFAEIEEPLARILSMRSIENVRLIFGEGGTLREAAEASLEAMKELSKGLKTFAVRAERVTKEAPFTSLDLARDLGTLLSEKLGLRVQLDAPDIVFYTEYERGTYRVGVDLTPFSSLRDRPYRRWIHRSALNPIIAYAMCRLAGSTGILVDPFCGSGTIVLECLSLNTHREAICADISVASLLGARENALAVGLTPHLYAQDVANPALRENVAVDAIVTNPPFGLRERPVGGLERVYAALFSLAERVLAEGGRLVVLTPHRELIQRFSRLNAEKCIEINEGGLTSWIYVFSIA